MTDADFMAAAVEALQKRWWQAKDPKVANRARELSAVKQWRKRVGDDKLLIAALEMREGPPIAFLYAHKRGRHGDMNQLLAKARQQTKPSTPHISDSLKDFARSILEANP